MKAHYDFSKMKGEKNPYIKHLRLSRIKKCDFSFVPDLTELHLTRQLQKITCRNRARVLEKHCSGTFKGWLHTFPDEIRTSPKVNSSVTPNFR